MEDWVRDLHLERGYDLVVTPHIARSVLWETSGHLAKYRENMYPPMEADTGDYYVKPMNCPFHVLVYKSQVRSYRDLPMRLSELGTIYRHEKAGTLHGLLRIRGGTQDDSHIICTPDQLIDEILATFDLTLEIHRTFGFTDPVVELSTLPVTQSIVDEETAARATEALTLALEKSGLEYRIAEGEGAFYGPKVDFHFRDAIGRLWQLNQISVAQEHFCTAATQHVMTQLYARIFSSEQKRRDGARAVAMCVGGELHEVGLRIVTDVLELEGWQTWYLGASMPPGAAVQLCVDQRATVMLISATLPPHLERVEEVVRIFRSRPELAAAKIVVGGRAFRAAPDMWRTIGADGYAVNADDCLALLERITAR